MRDWRSYWEDRPKKYGPEDFCQQVGRTYEGRPTTEEELRWVLDQAEHGLRLQPTDRLLDLCCGNGLLTVCLAEHCADVVGVDYSAPMIELAQRHHARDNVRYYAQSVLDLEPLAAEIDVPFNKVVMFESLQYFQASDLPVLLRSIRSVTTRDAVQYFTGVLDRALIWKFYNTPERQAEYHRSVAEGREAMGNWWDRGDILSAANEAGLRCEFFPQDSRLNTAHYRFDVRVEAV